MRRRRCKKCRGKVTTYERIDHIDRARFDYAERLERKLDEIRELLHDAE